ncbi:MAG: hypothetical protein V4459_12905 [Pseudomonadota bacterium]
MSGGLMLIAGVGAICALNYVIGLSWSQLNHNPWSGKFLGGLFSGPKPPSLNPGRMKLEKIREHGRVMMVMAPIIFTTVTVVVGLRLLIVGHL